MRPAGLYNWIHSDMSLSLCEEGEKEDTYALSVLLSQTLRDGCLWMGVMTLQRLRQDSAPAVTVSHSQVNTAEIYFSYLWFLWRMCSSTTPVPVLMPRFVHHWSQMMDVNGLSFITCEHLCSWWVFCDTMLASWRCLLSDKLHTTPKN